MANTRTMVTRTIKATEVTLLCVDVEKGEPFNKVITLPRVYKDDKAIMKVASKYDTETEKAVHVVATKVIENLYGMEEADFIKYATILPPRTAKEL